MYRKIYKRVQENLQMMHHNMEETKNENRKIFFVEITIDQYKQ